MEKSYNPQTIETKWAKFWEKHQYAKPSGNGEAYCIMLPPPNVTGTLHMGHGFQQTLMDALIRKNRMQGKNTLWQGGTDHAGIATQMVVERQLAQQGQTRHDLGRDKFIERIWQWRYQSGNTITQQIRRLGASIDWSRERFSMDNGISEATRTAFMQLYEEGLIYRGKRLVNWDPQLNTAISDLEVTNEVKQGHLWYIRYPLTDNSAHVVVATTRPETMLGDTAVAVHPDDERYQHLIGKTICLPLAQREIPIIADQAVDREFGTGCVKITPAHDFNDYEMGKRHQLPIINILTPDAKINTHAPTAYQGLDRYDARQKIIADLTAKDLIAKTQPHQLNVPKGDRSGVAIEPYLTNQWFVKMESLAKPAIDAVKTGKIKFTPLAWNKTYLQWLENIQDWCISRQLWWGHRIPVWYDQEENVYVGHDEADIRKRYQLNASLKLTQDEDVLDTWFSASLWPFATLNWPQSKNDLKTFYPTDVLVTGFDIIFFWVARMVMMGIKLVGDIPFKEVYITGLIRDSHGQKMSKSKGNILDPIDLIDGIDLESLIQKRTRALMQPQMANKITQQTRQDFPNGIASFGTDALRFTFCALASTGRDINFDLNRCEGYRNFCNKIWNAARYVLMNTEDKKINTNSMELSLADRWIRSRLQFTIQSIHHHFKHYRFDLIAQDLYEFIWNEYCDWYLELSKVILNNQNATTAQLNGTRHTLLFVLESLLRLAHPIMPYITEEIWQRIAPLLNIDADSIMLQPYPEFENQQVDQKASEEIEWLKEIIIAIRNIRGEMNVSPAKKINLLLNKGASADQERIELGKDYIQFLSRINEIHWQAINEKLPASATAVVDQLELHIPLAGLIDKTAEISRLQKEIEKLNKEFNKSQQKLNNPNYVNKAPEAVVAKERERLTKSKETLEKLQAHFTRIESL